MKQVRDGRLHLRHDQALLDQVKAIARKRGVTLTFLVDQYFQSLLVEEEKQPKTDEDLGIEQL